MCGVTRNRLSFFVNQGLFRRTLNVDLQLTFQAISTVNNTFDSATVFAELHCIFQVVRTKRSRVREQIDRFQPVGFSLRIIAVENI